MFFGKSYWRSQEQGIQREWLLTNGIGGFSSGTIIGMNARRYHGLLVASLMPPTERYLILSGISESVTISGGDEYYLHSFQTPDFQAHGEHHLEAFQHGVVPIYHYRIGSVNITKTICLRYGMNQVAVVYRIKNHPRRMVFRLTPLVNYRNYHYLSTHQNMTFSVKLAGNQMEIVPYDKNRLILLGCSEGKAIVQNRCFFYNMDYPYEHERGLNATEDHYIPGYYEIELQPGEEKVITVVCSVDDSIESLDGEALIAREVMRQKALLALSADGEQASNKALSDLSADEYSSIHHAPSADLRIEQSTIQSKGKFDGRTVARTDSFLQQLILAADKFIVYRKSTNSKTVIAGYPWFTDWGRDTMIALPGLTLPTKRFEDARDILYTFALYEKDGLIPNVFPDGAGEPAYNTVDAALWYFEAVWQYLQYTKDWPFVKDQLRPILERIIQGYKRGTLFQIQMDKDSLIQAGNENTQLTWMDAKAGSWVVTPRHGKAVEINALWYNALMVMASILDQTGDDGTQYRKLAGKTKKSFIKAFWNETANCLYDVVNEMGTDGKIRPNQIMAVSLSFPVLEGEQAKSVVDTVHQWLYTALGLRTLDQKDPQYRGVYSGDQYARDGAYHQGTVWTWPLGRFITGYARVYKDDPKLAEKLGAFFLPFRDHLNDAGIGSISEIFDGIEPLIPRGAFAQAWSVSEILRAYVEDFLPLKRDDQ